MLSKAELYSAVERTQRQQGGDDSTFRGYIFSQLYSTEEVHVALPDSCTPALQELCAEVIFLGVKL